MNIGTLWRRWIDICSHSAIGHLGPRSPLPIHSQCTFSRQKTFGSEPNALTMSEFLRNSLGALQGWLSEFVSATTWIKFAA